MPNCVAPIDFALESFDRILLDAPCSATGVIRRHPDIKVLRTPQDVAALCAKQRALLRATWPLLAPGGLLLYTTCSLLAAENQQQVREFVAAVGTAHVEPIAVPGARDCEVGLQLLPTEGGPDGFYYALLHKA
jgi:16S rRNA (cytosine967-C5)-methyltransferase